MVASGDGGSMDALYTLVPELFTRFSVLVFGFIDRSES